MTNTGAARTRSITASTAALAAAIVVVSLNRRPAIVAVGPLADTIKAATGLSATAISLLTTVPLMCLGVFAAAAPPIGRRIGFERGVMVALVLVVAGVALRLPSSIAALFAGTAVAGGGIAIANVLVPALIKRDFPHRIGVMMSIYSIALQTGATVASGVTDPLRSGSGVSWREALSVWGLPAALAALVWLPLAARRRTHADSRAQDDARPSENGVIGGAERADGRIWRTGLGWACAGFLGLQSAIYFSLTAWLPSQLHDHGMSHGRAGLMLSVVGIAGIAGGLPMPVLAARRRHGRAHTSA